MSSDQEINDQFLASLKYCLHCEKTGHQTTECWSTHGLNTARDLELYRLSTAWTLLQDAATWLHAAYDLPPQTPECKAMLGKIDGFLATKDKP